MKVDLRVELRRALVEMELARLRVEAAEATEIQVFRLRAARPGSTLAAVGDGEVVRLAKLSVKGSAEWRSAVSRYEFYAGRVRTLSAALTALQGGRVS